MMRTQIPKNIELYSQLYGNEIYLNSFSEKNDMIVSNNSLGDYIIIESGNPNAKIVFIVDDLERDQNIKDLSFPGRSRQLLDKMFSSINLDKNFFLANIVKYKTPNNHDLKEYKIKKYNFYLNSKLEIIKPKLIVALGKRTGMKILKIDCSLNDMRNKIFDYKGMDFIVTYHPIALLRDQNLKKFAWQDLKLIRDKYINA